jgi:hypothetical protein
MNKPAVLLKQSPAVPATRRRDIGSPWQTPRNRRAPSSPTVTLYDSSVGWADGVRVPVGSRIFLFYTSSRPVLGPTQPPIQWVPGALFPGVKRQRREADHSSPTIAEVNKTWIYTSPSRRVVTSTW